MTRQNARCMKIHNKLEKANKLISEHMTYMYIKIPKYTREKAVETMKSLIAESKNSPIRTGTIRKEFWNLLRTLRKAIRIHPVPNIPNRRIGICDFPL